MSTIVYRARKETQRIILHDSHTTPDIEHGEDVPRWSAMARDGGLRMGLLGVGYHFVVERDGTVVETRKRHLVGTHTPGHNMDSIGVCLVGGREGSGGDLGVNNFTRRQKRSLLELVAGLRKEFSSFGDIPVLGHSEVQKYRNKSLADCPCMDMEEFRQDLALYEHNGAILDESGIL